MSGLRPGQSRERSELMLRMFGVDTTKPALLGVRGYYLDSMGKPGVNDRGIYDDAVFIVSPSAHVSFRFNTDPSSSAPGRAVLQAGKVWTYKRGIHGLSKPKSKQYMALVQADEVTVLRDGWKKPDTGWFGINIHRGGSTTTSSLGCQTVPYEQWEAFYAMVCCEMDRYKVKTIPYLLLEYQG